MHNFLIINKMLKIKKSIANYNQNKSNYSAIVKLQTQFYRTLLSHRTKNYQNMEPKKLGKVAKVTGLVLLIGVIAVAVVFIVVRANSKLRSRLNQVISTSKACQTV